jgi:hypothetical protein
MLFNLSQQFPRILATVGRILVGYGELEYGVLAAIEVVAHDYDALFKAMFRTRGETQRLEIADALGRHRFHAHGLGTEFEMAMGAVQYCRKIRNQYAHCHWLVQQGRVGFVDLEELAKGNSVIIGTSEMAWRKIDDELVTEQEQYFNYAGDLLFWVGEEAGLKTGKSQKHEYPKPRQVASPPLYRP